MQLFNEDSLLDIEYRKAVIDEIEGAENIERKAQMKKRHEVYKDNTKQFVLAMMQDESEDRQVVKEIIHRLSNISFCKKVIDKKAMLYKDGVKREVIGGAKTTQQLEVIVDKVNLNSVMKKINKYVELFRNTTCKILPYKNPVTGKYYYRPTVMQPYLYDVIEDGDNPEVPRVYIESYFTNGNSTNYAPANQSGVREFNGAKVSSINFREGDNKDQIIADSPSDMGENGKEYIWWSNSYHFTTDKNGFILEDRQENDLLNPIGILPYQNFTKDQDGAFWAVGGEDIIDGAILLNMLLSDLFYIAKYQGMGIGYMFGKGVPKNAKVGASSFITMEVEEGDPTPQIGFATSNPPIQAHLDMIEAYISLLLSTNQLEAGTVNMKLSVSNAASGIHEMIKRAENVDDIQNQREMYKDNEPKIFDIIRRWHNLLIERNVLDDEVAKLGSIDEKDTVKIKFPDPQPFITEKERLENIKIRLELGLDSMIDAIIKDNPELSEDDAQQKLQKILEEKLIESSNKLKLFVTPNDDAALNNKGNSQDDLEDE